jgi:addiction module RelE/StbE family toxin
MGLSFVPKAMKQLEKLPQSAQKKLKRILDIMEIDLSKVPSTKLKGYDELRRVHAGKDYVIIYAMDNSDILIARVGHRSEIYENLDALKALVKEIPKKKK